MNYSELDRVRGSVEELALKKQLPLRQQANKPILKYDTSLTKQVQLLSQAEGVHRAAEARPPPAVSNPTPAVVSQNGLTKATPQNGSTKVASNVLGSRGHRKSRGSSIRRMQSSPANGVENPYSRPLSAKEVSEDVQRSRRNSGTFGSGTSGTSMVHSQSASALLGLASEVTGGASSLQLNSFMRPQSTVHSDAVSSSGSSQKKAYRVVLAAGDSHAVIGRASSKPLTEKPSHRPVVQEHGREEAGKKQTASYPAASSRSITPTSAGEAPHRGRSRQTSATSVRNPFYTPNRPYSEVSEPPVKDNVAVATITPVHSTHNIPESPVVSTAPTAQWQPPPVTGSLATKPPIGQSANGSAAGRVLPKVPGGYNTAPMHIGKTSSGGAAVDGSVPAGSLGSMAGVEKSDLPLHNLTASSLLSTRMGTLRKMPVTHTLTGTLYYKKLFKEAQKSPESRSPPGVGEQRPRGDGAPSKVARGVTEGKVVKEKQKAMKALQPEAGVEDCDEDDLSTPSGERLPGDGEASCEELNPFDDDDYVHDDINDDDDGIDDLYANGAEDDGDSDDYTICSSLSQGSSTTVRLRSAVSRPSTSQSARRIAAAGEERAKSFMRPVTSSGEANVQPALRPSIFATIPPTLNFISEGEKVEVLPWEMRRLLKWRMSPITPNIVKHALNRIGFRITKKNYDWLGCFGKHMKAQGFKCLREYQKLNHFPGSFQLGRKDRLWRNLSRLQLSFGKKEFGFFPQTYVLPQDLKLLKRAWEDGTTRQKWIIKPPASARGIGIKVIHKWNQIPRRRPVIVQKYLSRPLLINDSKFDMRVYVYVTSFDPLRAYVFEDGLARFASCKYSSSVKNLNNKFMHLTNYSINKRNSQYQSNTDDAVCQGHKWSLKALWTYLRKEGVNTVQIWDSIKDLAVKTLISAEGQINSMVKANVRSRYTVHELFGFDVLLDENYQPWILEVNISPSLHSNSQLDINVKGQMIRDMFNLAGYRLPDKNDLQHYAHQTASTSDLSPHVPSSDYCMDRRLFTSQLAPDERSKHAYFCHRHQDEQVLQTILDTLTPDDVRILTESIDEDGRKGGFIRVFPTPSTHKYLRYFEAPRYYNLLLDQWVQRYNRMEMRGISLLQSMCEQGVHLDNPNDSTHRYQWVPPNATTILSARDNRQPTSQVVKGKDGSVSMHKSSQAQARLPRVRPAAAAGSPMATSSASQISCNASASSTPLGPSPTVSRLSATHSTAVSDPNR